MPVINIEQEELILMQELLAKNIFHPDTVKLVPEYQTYEKLYNKLDNKINNLQLLFQSEGIK